MLCIKNYFVDQRMFGQRCSLSMIQWACIDKPYLNDRFAIKRGHQSFYESCAVANRVEGILTSTCRCGHVEVPNGWLLNRNTLKASDYLQVL